MSDRNESTLPFIARERSEISDDAVSIWLAAAPLSVDASWTT